MKTASSSGRPAERSSCCWVPSPQSIRIRSPPARSRIAGRPRRAVGTDPAVPAKNTERSIEPSRLVPPDLHELEAHPAGLDRGDAHGVGGRAPAVRRRAGVEDLKAVLAGLEQRDVRVP